MIAAWLKEVLGRLKCPCLISPSCKIQWLKICASLSCCWMMCQCFMRTFLRFGVAVLLAITNSKISFVVSFFHIYHSHLLVVVLRAWWSACPEYRYFRCFTFVFCFFVCCCCFFFCFLFLFFFVFVFFLFLFFYSFFYTFRVFATVVKITKADRPVNLTIFHCRISTNQPA